MFNRPNKLRILGLSLTIALFVLRFVLRGRDAVDQVYRYAPLLEPSFFMLANNTRSPPRKANFTSYISGDIKAYGAQSAEENSESAARTVRKYERILPEFTTQGDLCGSSVSEKVKGHPLFKYMQLSHCPSLATQFRSLVDPFGLVKTQFCQGNNQNIHDFFKLNTRPVTTSQFDVMLQPKLDFCDQNTKLLIFTLSFHPNSAARQAIRESWGALALGNSENQHKSVRQVFVFGRHTSDRMNTLIRTEHEKYGDIVQVNFTEAYRNLSIKTHEAHNWILNACPNAQYILKTDDDVIVNIPKLFTFLRGKAYKRTMMGYCNNREPINRDKSSKFYVSCDMYPFNYYTRYLNGPGYLFTNDLTPELFYAYFYISENAIDDYFSSGRVPLPLNATHVCEPMFHSRSDRSSPLKPNERIVLDNIQANVMRKRWSDLQAEPLNTIGL